MRAYGEAVASKDPRDTVVAVTRLITGKVDRNHEYIPPPAQLAFQVDRARNERLDSEARDRPRIAAPEPKRDGTPEDRKAFVARIMDGFRKSPPDYVPTAAEHARKVRQTLVECAIAGDTDAMATLKAEDATIRLSDEALASMGITQRAVA